VGEIWAATLLDLLRRMVRLNPQNGKRLALQLVVDALKLAPVNPSFLNMRDVLLKALGHMRQANRVSEAQHAAILAEVWTAFARFGMGREATSQGASRNSVSADRSLPAEITAAEDASRLVAPATPDAVPDATPLYDGRLAPGVGESIPAVPPAEADATDLTLVGQILRLQIALEFQDGANSVRRWVLTADPSTG
jgi:hypothetical protein